MATNLCIEIFINALQKTSLWATHHFNGPIQCLRR